MQPAEHVIVTGASGFIGSAIARNMRERGYGVTGVARRACAGKDFPVRVSDYSADAIAALVSELRPVALVHAAGPASVAASVADPDADFAGSVLLFQRVLEGVRRSAARPRVACLSSAAVYGDPDALPISETAGLRPISPYGHHKLICETLAAEYAACFGVPNLVVRVFSVFGREQRRLLVWDLFRKFRDEAEVVLDGTGDEARDYLHVDELAAQTVAALRAARAPQVVLNAGSGRSVAVRELAGLVGSVLASGKNVSFTGRRRAADPREWRADMSGYEALTGERAATGLRAGIEGVLEAWRG